MEDKIFYSPNEVASILHISATIVRESLRQGVRGWDFPWIMAGSYMKIFKKPFDEWLASGGVSARREK